ncbi:MAG: hypothetical protein OK422_04400 [Thaumarchaeota archaeon]|nr:hypothetical protein [Nitrososphaerota archaeon]
MRHKWLALFIVLFVLFYAAVLYDASYPNSFTGFPYTPTAGSFAFLAEWGLIGSLLVAAMATTILRVLYVGLKRLFS